MTLPPLPPTPPRAARSAAPFLSPPSRASARARARTTKRASFAGRAVSRALALGSLEADDVERGDDVADFTPAQAQELADRVAFYEAKYARVGATAAPFVPPPGAPPPREEGRGS